MNKENITPSNLVKILVIENEVITAKDIVLRLSKLAFEVVGVASNFEEAIKLLTNNPNTDIALIDIELDDEKDGIDIAEVINERFQIPFIFLTSYSDISFVRRAKAVHPYAYMLKPFSDRNIPIAIELALSNFELNKHVENHADQAKLPEKDHNVHEINGTLFLRKDNQFRCVKLGDISYLEADNNYTTIYTKEGSYLYSIVLKKMEQKLANSQFLRVHRSYVINISAVEGFEGNTLFVDGKKIPVSKQYREKVFAKFKTI